MRNISFFALVVLAWSAICLSASAQNIQHTENKADQALKSGLNVDPSSLGMSITIPLGSYPGRAGLTLPVNVTYSSKVWRLDYKGDWEGQAGIHTENAAKFAEHSASGWTSSLDVPRIEYTGKNQLYDFYGNGLCMTCSAQPPDWYYVKRIHIHMPDGSSHELRADDLPHATTSGNPQYDFSGVFYAVDGSGVRYDTSTNTLFMADGSRYLFDSTHYTVDTREEQRATQYVDRHGNTLSYNASSRAWTDTVGRTLALPLPQTPTWGNVSYSLPGIRTTTLNYTFRWRYHSEVLTEPGQQLRYTGDVKCGPPNTSVTPYLFHGDGNKSICSEQQPIDRILLSEIELPNGQKYRFTYNIYGEIDKVYLPTGGYERYEYDQIAPLTNMGSPYHQTNRGVVNRWVSVDGVNETSPWHYEVPQNSSYYTVKATNPNGTYSERVLYGGEGQTPFGFESAKVGTALEERVYSATGIMLRRKLTDWAVTTTTYSNPTYTVTRNPRPTKEVSLILDTGGEALFTTTTFEHDPDLNVTATSKYNFVAVNQTTAQTGAIGTFIPQTTDKIRTDETTYLVNDPNIAAGTRQTYRDRNLIRLSSTTRVRNGAGTIIAQGEMKYDEAAYPLLTYGAVTAWSDPGQVVRGLATTARAWLDTNNTWLETHSWYDQCGSPIKMKDAKGNESEVEYSSDYHYAYPTHTISADPDGTVGPLTALTTDTVYDLKSGAVTSQTDANDQITTMEYASTDALGNNNQLQRMTKVSRPDGGWTAFGYSYEAGNLFILTQNALDASRHTEARQYFDALGRESRSYVKEGSTFAVSEKQYDEMGRVWRSANPYRVNAWGDTVTNQEWTTSEYDSLGRVKKVTATDGAEVSTSYSAKTTGTLGETVTVQDQAGKSRKSVTDALGRLLEVYEDPSNLNFLTTYDYDVLGNLRKVTQGAQQRYFMYDSFSRLIRAKNPEQDAYPALALTDPISGNSQWSTGYIYDNNGNLATRTDARGVTVTYTYDALNRATFRDYSDSTPDVTYTYDTLANNKGRLASVSSSVSIYNYTGYDTMGRVTGSSQVTDGAPYPGMEYTYDLAGNLTSQKYPSGRVVETKYDGAGRIAGVKQQGNTDYYAGADSGDANRIQYSAHGAVTAMRLGNTLWEHTSFNSRLQPTEIGLGTQQGGVDRLKLNYSYGSTTNNGNVQSQTITIPNGPTLLQSYEYDSLNRLKVASEQNSTTLCRDSQTNPIPCWKQTFEYDRYGNRRFKQSETTLPFIDANNQNAVNPTINEDNNNQLSGTGYRYDDAGNMECDPAHPCHETTGAAYFQYDAENKMVKSGFDANRTDYKYDGDGRRVKKVTGTSQATTVFVYNAMGQMVAEYSNTAPEPGSGGTSYLTSDHLGTPRIITGTNINDSNGGVKARHDYLPFGEEIAYNVGGRSDLQKYVYGTGGLDNARQKFTQYERDNETGLDYAQARYYANTQGRFTSPDPLLMSAQRGQPQSWNRYAYCLNNPLFYTDPTGLIWAYIDSTSNGRTTRTFKWYDKREEIEEGYTENTSHYASLGGSGYQGSVYLGDGPNDWRYISHEEYKKGVFHEIAEDVGAYFRALGEESRRREIDNALDGVIDFGAAVGGSGSMREPQVDIENSNDEYERRAIRLRHYTSVSGMKGIKNDGVIKPYDQNSVFSVRARGNALSPRDAESLYGIGRGRGNAFIEFNARPYEFSIIPRRGFSEFVFKGGVNLTDRAPTFHFNK